MTTFERIESVYLHFKDCDAGWIRFSVAAGNESITIHASHFSDPFPDFLCWMHAILTGVERCSFRVDEEGAEKEFVASRQRGGNLLFLVRDPNGEPHELLHAIVSRRQLIESFYTGIQEFARSSEYDEEQWAAETFGDRFAKLIPSVDEGNLIQQLTDLTREDLCKALFAAAPAYRVCFPDAPDRSSEISRAIQYLADPEDPINSAGLFLDPTHWDIPSDYDEWPMCKRTEYVLELLREQINSWSGCKLDELESPTIERYLECQDWGDD